MSTQIRFDDDEEEEEQNTFQSEVDRSNEYSQEEEKTSPGTIATTTLIDAYVHPFGWLPCERVTSSNVKLLGVPGPARPCSRFAPLYSRSLRDIFSEIKEGQGVLVLDEYDPANTDRWCQGIVESVYGDNDIVVRTMQGSSLTVTKDNIRPFYYDENKDASGESTMTAANSSLTSITTRQDITKHRKNFEHIRSQYQDSLRSQDLIVVSMRGDGNCLFRAASHQVYGTDEHHVLVRKCCAEYMMIEKDYFEPFVAETSDKTLGRSPYTGFDQYVAETRNEGIWGDDPELQAICELYQRPCEVYCWDRAADSAKILRRLNDEIGGGGKFQPGSQPMRFSFMGGGHYDSIIPQSGLSNIKAKSKSPSPGILERRALEIAQARHAGGVSAATRISDAMETERAEIEEALQRSRQVSDEKRANGFNLQEALALSLKSVAAEDSLVVEQARLQSLREAEDAELARVLQESLRGLDKDVFTTGSRPQAPPSDFDDDALLRLAIEESLK